MENNRRVVVTLALVAVIAVAAIGIGYAYTASTSNSNNDVDLKYLTIVPTNGNGFDSYEKDFDGKSIKYNSETRKATAEDVRPGGDDESSIAVGDEIIVYKVSPTEAYDTDLDGNGIPDALKIGEIYLQIDERENTIGDKYFVKMKAVTEAITAMNTEHFYFKVGFQTKNYNDAAAPIANPTDGLSELPSGDQLRPYAKGDGAVSAEITSVGTGFVVVKVTLWLTGVVPEFGDQKFLKTEIYPASGDAKKPEQPMAGVKFELSATVPEVNITGITLNKDTDSLDLSEKQTDTLTVASTAPTNAPIKNVIWSTSDSTKVTVDSNGVIRPVATGEATITATSAVNGSVTATCTVTVTE